MPVTLHNIITDNMTVEQQSITNVITHFKGTCS